MPALREWRDPVRSVRNFRRTPRCLDGRVDGQRQYVVLVRAECSLTLGATTLDTAAFNGLRPAAATPLDKTSDRNAELVAGILVTSLTWLLPLWAAISLGYAFSLSVDCASHSGFWISIRRRSRLTANLHTPSTYRGRAVFDRTALPDDACLLCLVGASGPLKAV